MRGDVRRWALGVVAAVAVVAAVPVGAQGSVSRSGNSGPGGHHAAPPPDYATSNRSVQNVLASREPVLDRHPFTGQRVPVTDHSESVVAVNPRDRRHLTGASKFFVDGSNYLFQLGWYASRDGGRTWRRGVIPGFADWTIASDPTIAFGPRDEVYGAVLAARFVRRPDGSKRFVRSAIYGIRSGDGGETWDEPVAVESGPGLSLDKQWLTADAFPRSPYRGHAYLAYTAFGADGVAIRFSRSTDGGGTWSAPVAVATGRELGAFVSFAQLAVGPRGNLHLQFTGLDRSPQGAAVYHAVSTDGGQTFTPPRPAFRFQPAAGILPGTRFRNPPLPSLAVNPRTGTVLVAYPDGAAGNSDIRLRRSEDGGQTWSDPVPVNDNLPDDATDQFQPVVAAGEDGTVAVAFYDRRLPCPVDDAGISAAFRGRPNTCIDASLAFSTDDGRTFAPNLRLTHHTWDPSWHAPRPGCPTCPVTFIGDYFGLTLSDRAAVALFVSTHGLDGANLDHHQQQVAALVPLPGRTPADRPTDTGADPGADPGADTGAEPGVDPGADMGANPGM